MHKSLHRSSDAGTCAYGEDGSSGASFSVTGRLNGAAYLCLVIDACILSSVSESGVVFVRFVFFSSSSA